MNLLTSSPPLDLRAVLSPDTQGYESKLPILSLGGLGRCQDRKTYLTGYHEHGEDEDEAGFGHWEPAGLLEGEEDGSVQAGLGGAGGVAVVTGRFCMAQASAPLSQAPFSAQRCWSQHPSQLLQSAWWEGAHVTWMRWYPPVQ